MFIKDRACLISAYMEDGDGVALETGVTCKILADDGTLTSSAGAPTHKGSGVWQLSLTAEENSGDVMAVLFSHTSRTVLQQWHNQNNSALSADHQTVAHTYTVTDRDTMAPIPGVKVECRLAGTDTVIGLARTDENGEAVFYIEPGTYDFYATKYGYQFTNPDQEEVS